MFYSTPPKAASTNGANYQALNAILELNANVARQFDAWLLAYARGYTTFPHRDVSEVRRRCARSNYALRDYLADTGQVMPSVKRSRLLVTANSEHSRIRSLYTIYHLANRSKAAVVGALSMSTRMRRSRITGILSEADAAADLRLQVMRGLHSLYHQHEQLLSVA